VAGSEIQREFQRLRMTGCQRHENKDNVITVRTSKEEEQEKEKEKEKEGHRLLDLWILIEE
jgi:hypothetical protein